MKNDLIMTPRMRRKTNSRRGTVTLEAAIILPVMIFLIVGAVDVGQYINLAQVVSNASHEGARLASRHEIIDVDDVKSAVRKYLADSFSTTDEDVMDDAIEITLKDEQGHTISGEGLGSVPSGDPIYVTVAFEFRNIRWISGVEFWNNKPKSTTTVCRRE